MKYRLLFYVPKWGDGHIADNVIELVTLLPNWRSPRASHVEVWLPDENGKFGILPYCRRCGRSLFCGKAVPHRCNGCFTKKVHAVSSTCFTSTMRGDDNGTVMRPASKVLKNPKRWFYYELECDDADFDMAMLWAETACKNNKGYGKRTLLKFIGINWIDKLRKICSQISYKWGVLCENFPMPKGKDDGKFVISPRRLAAMCEKLGLEKHEL